MNYRFLYIYTAFFASLMALLLGCKSEKNTERSSGLQETAEVEHSRLWQKTDTSIALVQDNEVVWQFNYSKKFDKPYFHPVRVAGQPFELVWLRPLDHLWHRGLWFSWKYINEVNYWEEDSLSHLSNGRSMIDQVSLELHEDYSAHINVQISYAPEGGQLVLKENRRIFVSSPDASGNYTMDWDMKFTSDNEQVLFDRTLPPEFGGPEYGGYGGLSYRASENMTQHHFMSENGWENQSELVGYGERGHWMDLSGTIDSLSQTRGGITMFSHPSNANSPTPWYVYKDQQFAFYNAALLFDKPLKLEANSAMQLVYGIYVHQGSGKKEDSERQYQKFIELNRK